MSIRRPRALSYQYLIPALLLCGVVFPLCALATKPLPPSWDTTVRVHELANDPRVGFETVYTIKAGSITVPTVFEVSLTAPDATASYEAELVVDADGVIVPTYLKERYVPERTNFTITTESGDGTMLSDAHFTTGVSYPLPESRKGLATFLITPEVPFTVSGLTFSFGRNVTPPTAIEIRSRDAFGRESIVLSRTKFISEYVSFIPTETKGLVVYLEYEQPLMVTEIQAKQDNIPTVRSRNVRFLAQPGQTYFVYDNLDRRLIAPYMDSSNLMHDKGVVIQSGFVSSRNPRYAPLDTDADGIPDTMDNCISIPNTTQEDADGNRIGDVCDDHDRDAIYSVDDNCPTLPNDDQRDEDGDGIGDVCDVSESRFTERLPWVPWVGMGVAALVVLSLFVVVLRQTKKSDF